MEIVISVIISLIISNAFSEKSKLDDCIMNKSQSESCLKLYEKAKND